MAEKKTKKDSPVWMNIWQKKAAVRKALPSIGKSGRNKFQNYNYVEASEVDKALSPVLLTIGLEVSSSLVEYHVDADCVFVTMHFKVINVDEPKEFIEFDFPGQARVIYAKTVSSKATQTVDDKAIQKAITSAQKYGLLKFFGISVIEPELDTENPAGVPVGGENEEEEFPL